MLISYSATSNVLDVSRSWSLSSRWLSQAWLCVNDNTNLKIDCKYVLFLYCVFSTLRFMYATQSSESHLFGQKFWGWAGSTCPPENTWGLECPCIFCIWVPCPSRENPAHWILLQLLINLDTLSKVVRFSSCSCLWVVEPLLFVKVLLGSNHVEKYLVVTLIIRYFPVGIYLEEDICKTI